MRFVVTGTGRSGTRWASEVLGVGHQAMFTGEGFVDSEAQGDCSFWAASQNLEGWRVVLLVRDPRYVVGSWLASGGFEHMLGRGYWRLWQHCRRIDPTITEAMDTQRRIEHYWALLNLRMAERADVVLRLEECQPFHLDAATDYATSMYPEVVPPESTTEPVDITDNWVAKTAKEFGYDC